MLGHHGRSGSPFLVTGERYLDDYIIRDACLGIDSAEFEKTQQVAGYGEEPWSSIRQPIQVGMSGAGYKQRILMAFLGGISLLVPMWMMAYTPFYTWGEVMATFVVLLFAMSVATVMESPKDVLMATAAYAAVLATFVIATKDGDSPGKDWWKQTA